MSLATNAESLRGEQYRDASNLAARIALHARFSTNALGWYRWVFERLPALERLHVLELGCGPGKLWTENAGRIPSGWSIRLSDASGGMVGEARRSLARAGAHFEFVIAGAEAVPFRNGSFECVVANHVLYHVSDRPAALREIARVLAPKGALVASTVGDAHMRELDVLLRALGVGDALVGSALSAAFTLENGRAQLEAAFEEVALHRYPDALVVTEAEPLVAYARSLAPPRLLPADALDSLRGEVAARIERDGALRVTKDSGLFVAHGGRALVR